MKNIELLFEFPIVVYDAWDLHRAQKKDEESYGNNDERVNISFAIGKAKLQPQEIKGWYEAYTRNRLIEEVIEKGFNGTAILTHSGDFLCSWTIEKFEKKYEEHMNKLQLFIDEEREKEEQHYRESLEKEDRGIDS